MADDKKLSFYCERCNRTMNSTEFYQSNDKEKYPDRFLHMCKKCITARVDNWNPDTYLWILQEIDVPYVPEEWNKLLATYGKDRDKLTGTTILGRYLSKMKLKQHKDFRWKDTEYLQELANNKIELAMKRSGYDAAQISDAINKATFFIPEGELTEPSGPPPLDPNSRWLATGDEDYFGLETQDTSDALIDELTEDDKMYLKMKWGKMYKIDEQIALEKLYNEMMESYDI